MKTKYFFFFILILFVGCKKPAPQLPHNKMIAEDSIHIRLAQVNEVVAKNQDSLLEQFVKKQPEKYTKTKDGIWYYKIKETNGDSIIKQKISLIEYKSYTIEKKNVKSVKLNFQFNKKEVIPGLEKGLELMKKGEKIKLIVPWNLAYGSFGKDDIEPYTSFIFEVEAIE